MPSRRRASSTTAAWLSGVTSKAAPASRARSTSKATASDWAIRSGATRHRRQAPTAGPTWMTFSPATPSGCLLVARIRMPGASRRSASASTAHGVEQVLTVVEDEQQPLRGDVLDQPRHGPPLDSSRSPSEVMTALVTSSGSCRPPAPPATHHPRSRAAGRSPTEAPGGSYQPHPARRGSPGGRAQRRLDLLELATSADEARQLAGRFPRVAVALPVIGRPDSRANALRVDLGQDVHQRPARNTFG